MEEGEETGEDEIIEGDREKRKRFEENNRETRREGEGDVKRRRGRG